MRYLRVMPPPPRKSRVHCDILSKLNTINLDLSLANILNAQIFWEWLYGICNLVSMFQFKISQESSNAEHLIFLLQIFTKSYIIFLLERSDDLHVEKITL